MNGNFIAIGHIDDIPVRGARCVKTAYGKIAVFRTASDEVFATDDRCPHKGGPLSDGIVHGRAVTCPLHNFVFSLEDGEAQGADEGRVRTYQIENRGGELFISLSAFLMAAE